MKTPLLWFLIAGSALFALDMFRPNRSDNTIHITQGDIQGIRDQWKSQSGEAITQGRLDALVIELIQERRLSREAIELNLDQDDVIVRRRLEQKLRFLTESLSDSVDPTESDLEAFFVEHQGSYDQPAGWSFRHIFFSAESRGDEAEFDATSLLFELQQKTNAEWQTLGDPFILGKAFANRSVSELEQLFGTPFVDRLSQSDAEDWYGPLRSPFGHHLVWIEHHQPARAMTLEHARKQVLYDYRVAQRKLAFQRYLANLAQKYPVVMPAGT